MVYSKVSLEGLCQDNLGVILWLIHNWCSEFAGRRPRYLVLLRFMSGSLQNDDKGSTEFIEQPYLDNSLLVSWEFSRKL